MSRVVLTTPLLIPRRCSLLVKGGGVAAKTRELEATWLWLMHHSHRLCLILLDCCESHHLLANGLDRICLGVFICPEEFICLRLFTCPEVRRCLTTSARAVVQVLKWIDLCLSLPSDTRIRQPWARGYERTCWSMLGACLDRVGGGGGWKRSASVLRRLTQGRS